MVEFSPCGRKPNFVFAAQRRKLHFIFYLLSFIFYLLSIPAYTRPTYLLYHKQHVLFNPEYAQILHSKIVGSANRRNTKAVI